MTGDQRPTAATNGTIEEDDGLIHMHARCHIGGRVAAWIDRENRLTIACGECWRPMLTLQDHCGVLAGIRALGCQVPGCREEGHNHG